MTQSKDLRVAIVGAGMAGLSCARALHRAGASVSLFDKGRRPGGRLSSRRTGEMLFDYGAQYATAKGGEFQAFLSAAGDRVAAWDPSAEHKRWVGVPGMSALARAAERDGIGRLHSGRQVTWLSHGTAGWSLRHGEASSLRPGQVIESGEVSGAFDAVVLAMPPVQAAALLGVVAHPFEPQVRNVRMLPCWSLMLAFDARQQGEDTRSLQGGTLDWIARDSSRPGRAALPDCWIGTASGDWSKTHLEATPETVLPMLLEAFRSATGIRDEPRHASVHRWRYAKVDGALGRACLHDPSGLVVCGDWCLGPRVEAAFDSGLAAARALSPGAAPPGWLEFSY